MNKYFKTFSIYLCTRLEAQYFQKSPKSPSSETRKPLSAKQRSVAAVIPMSLPPPRPLYKQHSWSPDAERDEAWLRRKESYSVGLRRSQSLTNDDLEELKGCIELGFGFEPDSLELEPKLSDTLPALPLYCAVNRHFGGRLSRSSSTSSMGSFSDASSTCTIIDQGDDPETIKTRLRQWAQLVACLVRQFSGESN